MNKEKMESTTVYTDDISLFYLSQIFMQKHVLDRCKVCVVDGCQDRNNSI